MVTRPFIAARSLRLIIMRFIAYTRKSFHALTAFSKKNSGGSNIAGSFLCSDGRGEAIVFEVHLPNASPVGDPSPVVTKVTEN